MRVAVTGTPGTGKTTAVGLVETDLDVVHLTDIVESEGLYTSVDEGRDSLVADLDALRERVGDGTLAESHLVHHLDADRVVVLRCHPTELRERLDERGVPPEKARENAEAEALDVILVEALDRHGPERVFEVDTTGRSPDAVARDIEAVVAGRAEPRAGTVSFADWL